MRLAKKFSPPYTLPLLVQLLTLFSPADPAPYTKVPRQREQVPETG